MSGRRVALVVATDQYDDPELGKLAAPGADAQALGGVLGDENIGNFEIEVVTNASAAEIAEKVEGFFAERRPPDLALLHFSCHGLKDESGELYLAARNTRTDRLASTAVDAALVNRLMRRSRAQRVVLLLDCCYGGAFERGSLARADADVHVGDQFAQGGMGGGRGRVVITASSALEYALEDATLTSDGRPVPSVFTGALVNGIRSGEADRDQDGKVSLDELYDYVFDQVQRRTPHQTPSRWEFGTQGDVFVANNPKRRITPAPLPRELLDLVEHSAAGVRLGAVDELARVARGTDLPRAAGAALALRQLGQDDSRRVGDAAAAVLADLAPTVAPSQVEVGRSGSGYPIDAEVTADGSPLALASTVECSHPDIRADLNDHVLHIAVANPVGDEVSATVALVSAAGRAEVGVTVRAEGSRGGAPAAVKPAVPATGQPAGQDAKRTRTTELPRPAQRASLALMLPLAIVGAGSLAGAAVLPGVHGDFVGLGVERAQWLFVVPAVLTLLATSLLMVPRAAAAAVGVLAGVAVWSAVFCVKISVQGLGAVGLRTTVQGLLKTGQWALLVAAVLLAAVVVVVISASSQLRQRPTLQRNRWATAGAVLVLTGAAVPVVEAIADDAMVELPRLLTVAVGVVAACLPVAVLVFGSIQRTAALFAVSTFVLLTGGRDFWLVMTGSLDPHYTATIAGQLIALVGCFVSQGRVPADGSADVTEEAGRTHPA